MHNGILQRQPTLQTGSLPSDVHTLWMQANTQCFEDLLQNSDPDVRLGM